MKLSKTARQIKSLCRDAKRRCEIRDGSKHLKIYIDDTFVAILHKGTPGEKGGKIGDKNIIAAVNKFLAVR